MEILSFPFLIFTIAVVAVYYLLDSRAQKVWLLIASYVFYLTWGWPYALVLAVMTLGNFFLARRMYQSDQPGRWLRFGLLLNLLSFFLLKFASSGYGEAFFFRLSIGPRDDAGWTAVLLPIGFSFYILQAIGYLVDVSRRQCPPAASLLDFALYLAYFPKLLAGPIERARTFLPQFTRERKVDNAAMARGLVLIITGLFRKAVLADSLALLIPANLFTQSTEFSTLEKVIWLIIYAVKLYNDFAGYTGIMRGLSGLLGIELSANFRQPFFARTFSDFWNRWHISLSHWLRDYVFFPLRRTLVQRKSPTWLALTLPPMVTMLASGFWHGASLAMLLWGGLHGIFQIGEQVLQKLTRRSEDRDTFAGKALSALVIFIFVTLAWIPFGAADLSRAVAYAHGLFAGGFSFPAGYALQLGFALALSLILDAFQERSGEMVYLTWPRRVQVICLAVALLLIILSLGTGADVSGFIYQGF